MSFDKEAKVNPLPTSNLQASTSSFSSWGAAFQSAAEVKPVSLGDDFNPPSEEGQLLPDGSIKEKYGAGNVSGISQIAQESLQKISTEKRKRNDDLNDMIEKKKQKKEKKESKKKSKKKKKNKDVIGEDATEEDKVSEKIVETKGKSKKKKKSKKKSKEAVNEKNIESTLGEEDIQMEDAGESPCLEGQMVEHNDESLFVLIDKSKRKVYSMERTEAGELIPIGSIAKDGKIHIDVKEDDNDQSFPYEVDVDDHCESPSNSYEDILPILNHLAAGDKANFKIYDPYYCNGLVKKNLEQLGFTNVYNKKEDAYKTWNEHDNSSQPYPSYDLFITNPPYSGDHPERLMKHLTQDKRTKDKPWCLLMPQYIHKKDYYKGILTKKNKNGIQPFYLVPKKRYVYLPPKNFREKKDSDVHKKSSPFVSMWYIWGGSMKKTDDLIRAYERSGENKCEVARSTSALRDLRRKVKKK